MALNLIICIVITTKIVYGHKCKFSFDGTYNLTIQGEQRTLSVCTDDNNAIYWGINKELDSVRFFNYVYAMGRSPNGVHKSSGTYKAKFQSFWMKENAIGVREIEYYLQHKHRKYTLSSNSEKYILEKVSDEILGECMKPGMFWSDV